MNQSELEAVTCSRRKLQSLPWVVAVLQYLGNILPLIDSLSCYLEDKINIIDNGTAGARDVIQNGRQDVKYYTQMLKVQF